MMLLISAPVAGLALLWWLAVVPHSPELQRQKAAAIISATPEFNRSRSLVAVSATTRGTDSLKDCCYSAEFSFTSPGSETAVKAQAEFRYWDHAWHLQEFLYGYPQNGTTVWIDTETPPDSK